MNNGQNYIEKQIEKDTNFIKFEISIKNLEEMKDFIKFVKKKIQNLHIFDIKVNFEIYYKDKRCRF